MNRYSSLLVNWSSRTNILLQRRMPVLLLSLLFAGAWLAHLDAVALTPPADNIEQLIWVHSLELGYYKHPPLPTWLVWGAVQLFGWSRWTTYGLGTACTLASMAIFWILLREMRGPRYAFVALIAAYCVTFYNGRLYYYNHNTVLTLWVALSAWLMWRILTKPQLLWWALFGGVAALGMLSKYQYALTLVSSGLLYLYLGLWREPIHRWGLLLAAVLGSVLLAPHVWWLFHTEDGPLQYAMHSSLGVDLGLWARTKWSLQWALDWLFNRCLPAWMLVLAVRYWGLYHRPLRPTRPATCGCYWSRGAVFHCWR